MSDTSGTRAGNEPSEERVHSEDPVEGSDGDAGNEQQTPREHAQAPAEGPDDATAT